MKKQLVLTFIIVLISCTKETTIPEIPIVQTPLNEYKITPSATDAAITAFNNEHYVYLSTQAVPKNKLFVFLPGTSSSPIYYTTILKKAASMGYHTIGLMYPNSTDIYNNSSNNTDNTQFGKCRLEAFEGVNHTSGVTIDATNCIKNRLVKLLNYLQTQNPSQNWQQFLTGSNIDWGKCVVAGHSQGGGHAFFIAKQVAVARAISFSSIDWNTSLATNADWVTQTGATPISKFYSLNHFQDEIFNYVLVQTQLSNMSLTGPVTSIDVVSSPYNNSHILSTNAIPAYPLLFPFHNSLCINAYVPKEASGNTIASFDKAWEYLIGN